MTRARWSALVLVTMALIGAAALTVTRSHQSDPASPKPPILLLTSLPLLFGEDFSLEQTGSPALKALQSQYRVIPISVTDSSELAKGRLLLMAQPLAQTAENLVTLDRWVRKGGRVLLLADPMLEWPSKRPLGDPLRPPSMFADTGLLGHWGLRLDAPNRRGLVVVGVDVDPVVYVSPGRLVKTRSNCVLSSADTVAECKVGVGRAAVVADADFLDPSLAKLRNPTIDNTAMLMELLNSLAR